MWLVRCAHCAIYTHSLVGALLIAVLAGILASRAWGRRAGISIGVVVAGGVTATFMVLALVTSVLGILG